MENRKECFEEGFFLNLRYSMCKHMRRYLSDDCVESVMQSVFEDLEPQIKSDKVLWQVMRSALPRTDMPIMPGHSFSLPSRISMRLANIDAHLSEHAPDYTYRPPCSEEELHRRAIQTENRSARQEDPQPL